MSEPNNVPSPYSLFGPSEDGKADDLLKGKNETEARIRLQALIAEWLRMENLVVLTAAGCSVGEGLGGKTMANLDAAVLSTLEKHPDIPPEAKKIVSGRLSDLLVQDSIGFEAWLSFLVNAYHLATSTGSPFCGLNWQGDATPSIDDLKWLIDHLGRAIFAECALSLPPIPEGSVTPAGVPPHLAFLAKLVARDSNLGRANLFTLNYDTLFEQALERLGIQYFDGFSGRAEARFDPSVYGLDIYYPGEVAEGRVRRFDKFLHFYKLHGSIHWRAEGDELRARHPSLAPFADYRELGVEQKAQKLDSLTENTGPIGILPTANKFAQTLSMPFAHLLRSFQIRLSVPQTFLLVLGYGFGDEHVTRIIETALMNPSLVMLVVEPDPKSATIKRIQGYKELGRRAFVLTATEEAFKAAKFKHASFDDFAKTIMPDVQWLTDFLRLRSFEKQIASIQGDKAPALGLDAALGGPPHQTGG
ncbi:MAG: SIR2 family protein [Phenylobacterium sp.]|uniref:SIR2 family protein n=1 Tax=Phenylobacterium sp. TaxID=1871053 RepID=UPI0017A3BD60|nr:SIR2 family protein [Phenylobacterium sp.]MBA4795494.1 SIR2 family protein [Phenylobacterium sp.]